MQEASLSSNVMQPGLIAVDEKSKSKMVELESHVAVVQQQCRYTDSQQSSGKYCGAVMQAGLFTVDEKSKSKVVELKPDMAVAQQLRSSIIRPWEPIKIRRHQKPMDLIRRRSTDESRHPLNLEKISEAPKTPASTARCSLESASSLADSNWVRCYAFGSVHLMSMACCLFISRNLITVVLSEGAPKAPIKHRVRQRQARQFARRHLLGNLLSLCICICSPMKASTSPLGTAHRDSVADSTWASSCPFNKRLLACSAKCHCCASKRRARQHESRSSVEHSDWARYLC